MYVKNCIRRRLDLSKGSPSCVCGGSHRPSETSSSYDYNVRWKGNSAISMDAICFRTGVADNEVAQMVNQEIKTELNLTQQASCRWKGNIDGKH